MAHFHRQNAVKALSLAVMLAFASGAYSLPTGGKVAAGTATIAGGPGTLTINQTSQNVAINWLSFGIALGEGVRFNQPNGNSVALNRVLGSDPSIILGSLSSNGKVFLVNPNGILFGKGAQVNVGGLVASTLNVSDADFMAGKLQFSGASPGMVLNQGSINAEGGHVALLGANVSNQGTIVANLGSVTLAAGNAMTLDLAGDGLLNVSVTQGAVNALVQNGGLIRANGGHVLLTTQAAGTLLKTVVNNTGIIEAQTIENRNGTIRLMGDMQSGTVNAGGTLDASAPRGGDGGFIETSAAHVRIASNASITTAAPLGRTGTFLIDPQDFIIGGLITDNISGGTLSALLVNNSVIISTDIGPDTSVVGTPFTRNTSTPGNGDIFVNDAVSWTSANVLAPTTLTLNAARDVNVNGSITAIDGNLVICCGRDIVVDLAAAISTTRGSILLSAGRDARLNGAITVAEAGNLMVCAGRNVNVNAAITLDNGTIDPVRSLGLPQGLVLSAGTSGTGPGIASGTVIWNPIFPATVTAAPTTIMYNPLSYAVPTDYSLNIIGPAPTELMLLFPGATGGPAGGTSAVLTGFNTTAASGIPAGVTLVAGPGSTATFDTAGAGTNKPVSFTGFTLGGPNAADFAFATPCCGPVVSRTTGDLVLVDTGTTGGGLPVLPLLAPLLTPLTLDVTGGGVAVPSAQLAASPPPAVVLAETPRPPVEEDEPRRGEAPAAAPGGIALPPRHDRN